MSNAVHFTAEILNLDLNIKRLEYGKNYNYDSMNDKIKIVLDEL